MKRVDARYPERNMALPAKKKSAAFNESTLTKGQLRKLNALRKSVGPEIGEQAFAEWLASTPAGTAAASDPNAEAIARTLWPLVEKNEIRIPRGGYRLRRGRGRLIVEPFAEG